MAMSEALISGLTCFVLTISLETLVGHAHMVVKLRPPLQLMSRSRCCRFRRRRALTMIVSLMPNTL